MKEKGQHRMLGLQLRQEFRGARFKGAAVDFKNQSGSGALDVTAADFLKITYPSHDLLKAIEATGPGHLRPVVLLGARGQGKSHLMAALYHLCHDPDAGSAWLSECPQCQDRDPSRRRVYQRIVAAISDC